MQDRHAPLVSCETLFEHLDDPEWVVFDCRHDLMDPQAGPRAYQKAHIPGSYHAHVDRDLSGPVGNGARGRHPLPIAFQRVMQVHGVGPRTQIVAYDDMGGAWASRLWWLARHFKHEHVAVLDGGLPRWKALGLPVRAGHEKPRDGVFHGVPGAMPTIDAVALQERLDGLVVVDARAPERYRGETEPIDPVAGHIPGARNLPFAGNTGPDGRFLSPDELRARFEQAGIDSADDVVVYCGSGVTAAQEVLAMELAGLGAPMLYPGSWSEWCRPEAGRPVETGPMPARS